MSDKPKLRTASEIVFEISTVSRMRSIGPAEIHGRNMKYLEKYLGEVAEAVRDAIYKDIEFVLTSKGSKLSVPAYVRERIKDMDLSAVMGCVEVVKEEPPPKSTTPPGPSGYPGPRKTLDWFKDSDSDDQKGGGA